MTAQSGSGQSLGNRFSKDTLKILALMVEFQPDKYDATIGTGKFGSHYTQIYKDTIIDPLPHNKEYFDDHLEFAKNYFKKVSGGKLNIKYNTIPNVVTVSKFMRDYSPPYKSKDFTLLGNLSKEAWSMAAEQNPGVKFGDYDLFIIFHAGVSNSLSTGSYEINRNLPALYLGEKTFKNIYGNNFGGLVNTSVGPVIKNTIIMPETESREITAIDESVMLLQISINGELVSNIGSFLGLPDLYNTETGISAIGRFGLMDGQAMVANQGIFPPEPSAWEKVYMGWVNPAVTALKGYKASIKANSASLQGDTSIIKIPINDYEYYLIENRQQDALNDGIKITYRKGNQVYTDIQYPDTSGVFFFLEKNYKGGNVIDVDEFDASVPGNGIIIWRIDERIINEKFESGGINNDKQRKGVSVVEADGINDIGEIIKTVFGDVIGDGTIEDFWHSGNKTKYYKNRFADDSKPSAKSNDGNNSFITINNFSASGAKMSFDIAFGGTFLPYNSFIAAGEGIPDGMIAFMNGINISYLISSGGKLSLYNNEGIKQKEIGSASSHQPAFYSLNDSLFAAYINGATLNLCNLVSYKTKTINFPSRITAAPLLFNSNGLDIEILVGTEDGRLFNSSSPSLQMISNQGKVLQIASDRGHYSVLYENGIYEQGTGFVQFSGKALRMVQSIGRNGKYINIILAEGNKFLVYSEGGLVSEFRLNDINPVTDFIMADINNDGSNSIICTAGNKLYAVSLTGLIADNYPLVLPGTNTFRPNILSWKGDTDNSDDLIAFTNDGDVYFLNGKTGRILPSLSISSGGKLISANLHTIASQTGAGITDNLALTLLTENKSVYTWDLQTSMANKKWFAPNADYANSSFYGEAKNEVSYSKLLPEQKVYNWPNPVYGAETFIRFAVNEDAKVSVKVFDMGGQIVSEFEKNVFANTENEITLNTASLKSGIYFGRVEALSGSGKSEHKIIKIAVIK